jgi:hypothetical protein
MLLAASLAIIVLTAVLGAALNLAYRETEADFPLSKPNHHSAVQR